MERLTNSERAPSLEKALSSIESVCKPASIFLYGSQARGDTTKFSDYEVGVLLTRENYIGRSTLRAAIPEEGVSAYPFRLEDFVAGNPDTPFNKKIYLRELITAGKTLRGDRIIEDMRPPSIETVDILSDAQFNLGYALASTVAHRDGAVETVNLLFYKSALFGTRALLMQREGALVPTYDQIVAGAEHQELGEYNELIKSAYEARQSGSYSPDALFKNISYLNQLVVPEIREDLDQRGNRIVVE